MDITSFDKPSKQLAQLDSQTFQRFLIDPDSLTIAAESTAISTSPTKSLKRLASETVVTAAGRMSVVDAVVATLVDKALKGDMRALEKVYNELEHDGVHKVQTLNLYADFKAEFNDILGDVGIDVTPYEGTAEDISDTQSVKELPDTHDSLDPLEAFLRASQTD